MIGVGGAVGKTVEHGRRLGRRGPQQPVGRGRGRQPRRVDVHVRMNLKAGPVSRRQHMRQGIPPGIDAQRLRHGTGGQTGGPRLQSGRIVGVAGGPYLEEERVEPCARRLGDHPIDDRRRRRLTEGGPVVARHPEPPALGDRVLARAHQRQIHGGRQGTGRHRQGRGRRLLDHRCWGQRCRLGHPATRVPRLDAAHTLGQTLEVIPGRTRHRGTRAEGRDRKGKEDGKPHPPAGSARWLHRTQSFTCRLHTNSTSILPQFGTRCGKKSYRPERHGNLTISFERGTGACPSKAKSRKRARMLNTRRFPR